MTKGSKEALLITTVGQEQMCDRKNLHLSCHLWRQNNPCNAQNQITCNFLSLPGSSFHGNKGNNESQEGISMS